MDLSNIDPTIAVAIASGVATVAGAVKIAIKKITKEVGETFDLIQETANKHSEAILESHRECRKDVTKILGLLIDKLD